MLASSVQRSKPTPYPSKARSTLIRRTVVVVLVLVALTLLTISFRSPTTGALHGIEGAGSSALRPFQVAAVRVARPFRDAYDYFDSLASAKSENAKLKRQNAELRADAIIAAARVAKYPGLQRLLRYEQGSSFPHGFRAVNAAVISYPSGPYAHEIRIDKGTSSGLRVNTPVVSGEGLVGRVVNVFPDTAVVMLLTDTQSFVTARDLHTRVRGLVKRGPSGTLILDQVAKALDVEKGDELVTDGTRDPRYPDIYPYGIPIGRVAHVGVSDTANYLQVQVQPYASVGSIGSLDSVAALVATKRKR